MKSVGLVQGLSLSEAGSLGIIFTPPKTSLGTISLLANTAWALKSKIKSSAHQLCDLGSFTEFSTVWNTIYRMALVPSTHRRVKKIKWYSIHKVLSPVQDTGYTFRLSLMFSQIFPDYNLLYITLFQCWHQPTFNYFSHCQCQLFIGWRTI